MIATLTLVAGIQLLKPSDSPVNMEALRLLESCPSWYDFHGMELPSPNSEMLFERVKVVMTDLSRYKTSELRAVVRELRSAVIPNSSASKRFAKRHQLETDRAFPLAFRKQASVMFLNRSLFAVPETDTKGSPVFTIGSKRSDGSVDRHWPLRNIEGSFVLVVPPPGGGTGPIPEWATEFEYFAAHYPRRKT